MFWCNWKLLHYAIIISRIFAACNEKSDGNSTNLKNLPAIYWEEGASCAPTNVHNLKAIFSVLVVPWASTWTPLPETTRFPECKNAQPKSFCNFSALSELQQIPGKMQKSYFPTDLSRKLLARPLCRNVSGKFVVENPCVTFTVRNLLHQGGRTVGDAREPSFLAIVCTSACAGALVQVNCAFCLFDISSNDSLDSTSLHAAGP